MKKIGILTYHFSDNYGAVFQAYALKKWLSLQGCQVDFINYHPDYVEAGGDFNYKNPFSKKNLKILFLKLIQLKERFFGDGQQKNNFNDFRVKKLGVRGKYYKSLADIDGKLSGYDLLICGSDQIWKPSEHFGVDPVYFLDFSLAGSTPRKISYAPSFGKDSLDTQYTQHVVSLISKLDGVSVREKSGCAIISNLLGSEPVCVPDPTLLLKDYHDIIKPYPLKSAKHVFCYALRSRTGIGNVAESIASKLSCALYSPHNPHRRWREIGETVFPCPQQWLYLLSTSEFVVTNSFHGTALSIILHKPFVVVGLQGDRSVFNARVKNLLSLVGLESRFVEEVKPDTAEKFLADPIDWDAVDKRVDVLRGIGSGFLTEQIQLLSKKVVYE